MATDDGRTLSRAIHNDLETVREQNAQLCTRIDRLQFRADRKCGYTCWMAELRYVTEELQDKLSQWLDIPDPSTNYHAALQKRHPDTGAVAPQWSTIH